MFRDVYLIMLVYTSREEAEWLHEDKREIGEWNERGTAANTIVPLLQALTFSMSHWATRLSSRVLTYLISHLPCRFAA
jgi:hypothetical protein